MPLYWSPFYNKIFGLFLIIPSHYSDHCGLRLKELNNVQDLFLTVPAVNPPWLFWLIEKLLIVPGVMIA